MLDVTFLWLITALAIAVPCLAVATKRLGLFEDYYFFLIYVQFIIYLHLAPTLWAPEVDRETLALYVQIEAASLFLFEIPFLAVYIRGKRRSALLQKANSSDFQVHRGSLWALLIFMNILGVAYLIVAVSTGTFFFRYGNVENLRLLFSFADIEFYIFRLFQLSANFLICVCVACLCLLKGRRVRWQVLLLLALPAGVYYTYQFVNSRLEALATLALVFGVVLYVRKIRLPSTRRLLVVGCGVLVVAYVLRVTLNVRATYLEEEGLTVKMFNPFRDLSKEAPGPFSDLNTDLRYRLSGIDLMARMTPSAQMDGFARGDAWRGAIYVTFAQFLGRGATQEIKASFMSSPKAYLMLRYTTLREVDYQSCWLTDVYGNFWYFAFPVVGILTGQFWVWITRGVSRPSSPLALLLGLYFMSHFLRFEQEFATIALQWIRTVPILLLILLVNPLGKHERRVPTVPAVGRPHFARVRR